MHLQNKYFKSRSTDDCTAYKRQINYCSRLYKKEIKTYYKNLNLKDIIDNKKFWKTIKPIFSDKAPQSNKITIVTQWEKITASKWDVISDDQNISESLNNYFFNSAVASLEIKWNRYLL